MTQSGRITEIEQLPGSRRARRIWVDDAPFRVTSAAVVRALSLHIGDEVDPGEILQQLEEAERSAARDRALKLLSYHDFSTDMMSRKLIDDGYPQAVVEATVRRLVDAGLLDDARYAEAVARSRLRAGYGPRVVRRDLARAGLPEDLIERALLAAADDGFGEDAASAARRLARPGDDVRRLAGRLARRGFDAAAAYDAARTALGDDAACDEFPLSDDQDDAPGVLRP